MRFRIRRTSGGEEFEAEIETLEQLVEYAHELEEHIILSADDKEMPELEIYDDYRE